MEFTMEPGKHGRLRYLVMTLFPAWLFQRMTNRLVSAGVLPNTGAVGFFSMALALGMMWGLGYHLILRKNHVIEVGPMTMGERDWRGKFRMIPLRQVAYWRTNLLGEILLVDDHNRILLRVEGHLENRERFLEYLRTQGVEQKTKEH